MQYQKIRRTSALALAAAGLLWLMASMAWGTLQGASEAAGESAGTAAGMAALAASLILYLAGKLSRPRKTLAWAAMTALHAGLLLIAGLLGNALFGEKGYNPTFTSPAFTLSGDKATITIKVAPFANDKGTTLNVKLSDSLEKTFTMTKSKWNTFTIETTLNGTFKLAFTTADEESRLWFDDLLIEQTVTTTGISQTVADNVRKADNRIFTINGVYVGTDASNLPKGIYIMNGKKFVK